MLMPSVTTAPRIGRMRTHWLPRGTSSVKRPKANGTNGKTSISCMSVRPRRVAVDAEDDEVEQDRCPDGDREAVAAQVAGLPSARQSAERAGRRRERLRHAGDDDAVEHDAARACERVRGHFEQRVIDRVDM